AVLPEVQITGLYGTDTVNYVVTTDYEVGKPVGDYTITATLDGTYPNYVATTPVISTLTVTPAALTVKADDKTVIYGKEAPAYTVTCSGFQCKDNESSLNGTLAFDCVYTTTTKVGTYPITPKGWSSPNYKITYVDGTLTVIKADQTITFLPVGIVALEPVPLVAFADSGLEVSFTTDKPEMIAIEGNTATALLDGIATITAVQAGDENHNPASVDQIVTTVYKQYPIILWTVDPMPYGTPLGPEQQTAIAVDPAGETLEGEFEYDPAEGTVLEPGKQVLFVTFTPADLSRYYKVSGRTEVEVSKGDMVITWDPVQITYGTALGEEHFDLIATVDGKRIEGKVENQSPAIGMVVPVGSELLLSATFVPMDTTYEAQNASTSLTVTPAEPIVTIGNPEDPEEAITVVYGDTVTDEVTGARAVWFVGEEEVEVEGDFTYLVYGTETEGETMLDEETILPVGEYLLTAVFATEDSNYVEKTVSNEVTLIVEPAVPTVIVEDAGFEFGTVITDEDLSAMATGILEEPVDGTFEFFVAGVPLNELAQPLAVRAYPLTARFISADPNYTDAESEKTRG
ncbi:MAG: hypothetical protein IKQ24_01125, partial [Verrucomicrobia bacterium]|nr:hypothetical protein [Verrucomicrobiota bacterium]